MLDKPWSGIDTLAKVNGPADRFPPLRVLFLAHRVAGTGLLTLINIYGARGLWVQNGAIAALAGFPELLSGVGLRGEPGEDANAMVTRAITGGLSPDRVLNALGDGVAAALAGFTDLKGTDIRFRMDARPPPQLLPPLDPFPRLLGRGLREARPPERLRPTFGPRLNQYVRQTIPDDAPESRWGIDPTALRVLREAARVPTLGELLGSGTPSGATWLATDLLLQLGLLELSATPPTAAERPPAPVAERAPERSIDRSSSRNVAQPALDRSIDRSTSRNLASPADRPAVRNITADPERSVTGKIPTRAPEPAPPENPAVSGLREALAAMDKADEAGVLGITRSVDLTEEKIDRAFRDLSVRFHPDRHGQGSPEQRDLARRCFARVNDAYTVLRDPAQRADRQARMKAREEGRVYVSEADQRAARVAFARAEILIRQRRWADALADLETAARQDPTAWRYRLALVQAQVLGGKVKAVGAESVLRGIAGEAPTGAARADVLYVLGELLVREGQEKAANTLFEEALKEHPEHAGAKRRAWLQKRRADETPSTSGNVSSGLFGGLLNLGKKP